MKTPSLALGLCAALAALTAALAQPLPDTLPDTLTGPRLAEHWRATSRFGYGASPADTSPTQPPNGSGPTGKAWALQQLGLAARAAHEPARVPTPLSGFEAPLPTLTAQARQEREARRTVREQPPAAGTTAALRDDAAASPIPFSRDVTRKAAAWRLAACSRDVVENPLLARMTEFWFNHLNVFSGKGAVRPFVGHYVLNAIRPNALGRYEDLLLASAKHPAMLFYLDQARSVAEGTPGGAAPVGGQQQPGRGLNENYARELLELHTLGVHGGYTQADVRNLARILTGWTIAPQDAQGFRFAPRLHDHGDKQLLGQHITAGGVEEGEAAIRMLARHPATAQRISLRLAQFFVADQPPPALVQRLAQRYLATQGDIQAVMRTLIESPETWDAQQRLFKTPMDYACSVLTAVGGPQDERDAALTLGFLANAGQPVHGWQTPDGYKTDAATWLSPEALSRRADFAMAVGRRVTDAQARQALQAWLAPATRERIAQEPPALRAGLALASPEFMYK